jgi:Fe-S cluster assembly protein SufD
MASTTAVTETQFTEQFGRLIVSERDPRLRNLREEAFATFSFLGFPTVKNEDWKYTNAAAIGKELWKVRTSGFETPVTPQIVELLSAFNAGRNGFAALNLAFGDIQVIRIAKDTVVDDLVELRFETENGTASFPHIVVIVERGSKATLVEHHNSTENSLMNAAIQIFIEDGADLTHYRVQRDSQDAFNICTTEVMLSAGSRYDSTNINLGAGLSRHDIDVKFSAEGGEAFVDGLYMLGGTQHHDTHSLIDHQVPNCISHQTYKGVLNDSSRAVFNGKVFVRENARGTDAQQSNKNLLLSNDARVDTKPQLEIFNDDVKCSHGATVGQLEEEELFYLLTRGLPETLARNLLTYGFAEEVINKISIESIKKELDGVVLNRLNTRI